MMPRVHSVKSHWLIVLGIFAIVINLYQSLSFYGSRIVPNKTPGDFGTLLQKRPGYAFYYELNRHYAGHPLILTRDNLISPYHLNHLSQLETTVQFRDLLLDPAQLTRLKERSHQVIDFFNKTDVPLSQRGKTIGNSQQAYLFPITPQMPKTHSVMITQQSDGLYFIPEALIQEILT